MRQYLNRAYSTTLQLDCTHEWVYVAASLRRAPWSVIVPLDFSTCTSETAKRFAADLVAFMKGGRRCPETVRGTRMLPGTSRHPRFTVAVSQSSCAVLFLFRTLCAQNQVRSTVGQLGKKVGRRSSAQIVCFWWVLLLRTANTGIINRDLLEKENVNGVFRKPRRSA